jgi:mgtE-like transporter
MRGTIFGAIGARLGTSAAAGVFEVSASRTGVLYQNVYTGVVTTFSSSLYLAVLARFAALAFGLRSISFLDFVTISVVGGVLGSAVILLLTLGLSVTSYRRGYDLDTVSTPLVTAAGDMVTIPTLYLATYLVRIHVLDVVVAAVCVVVCLYATVRGCHDPAAAGPPGHLRDGGRHRADPHPGHPGRGPWSNRAWTGSSCFPPCW